MAELMIYSNSILLYTSLLKDAQDNTIRESNSYAKNITEHTIA